MNDKLKTYESSAPADYATYSEWFEALRVIVGPALQIISARRILESFEHGVSPLTCANHLRRQS